MDPLHSLTQLELLGKLSYNWAFRNSFPRLSEEDSKLQGSNPWLVVPNCEVVCGFFFFVLFYFVPPLSIQVCLDYNARVFGIIIMLKKGNICQSGFQMILCCGSNSDGTSFGKVPNTDLNAAQNHVCPLGFTDGCRCSLYLSLELDKPSSLEGIKRIWFVLWEKAFITHWSRNSEPHSWTHSLFVLCIASVS